MTIAKQMKKFGVKSIKVDGHYRYVGKNLQMDVVLQYGSPDYWVMNLDADNVSVQAEIRFRGDEVFERKVDAMEMLLRYDQWVEHKKVQAI